METQNKGDSEQALPSPLPSKQGPPSTSNPKHSNYKLLAVKASQKPQEKKDAEMYANRL